MLPYYERHGLVPASLDPSSGMAWLGVLTGMFLHVGPFHLAVNLICLRCFGRAAEAACGSGLLWPVYVFCGVMGAMCHSVAYPGSHLALVGASGAVSGLLGLNLLLRGWNWGPLAGLGFLRWRIGAGWLVGAWLMPQVLYLTLAAGGLVNLSGTALVLHVGGLAGGAVAALCLRWLGLCR